MRKELYLTFDMDWAIDEVLFDFYSLVKGLSIVGTIHVTHDTKFLNLFRKDNILDCGIHPNYNFLLWGQNEDESVKDILEKIIAVTLLKSGAGIGKRQSTNIMDSLRCYPKYQQIALLIGMNHARIL